MDSWVKRCYLIDGGYSSRKKKNPENLIMMLKLVFNKHFGTTYRTTMY